MESAPTVALVGMVTESGGHSCNSPTEGCPFRSQSCTKVINSYNCGIVEQQLPQGICRVPSTGALALDFVCLAT